MTAAGHVKSFIKSSFPRAVETYHLVRQSWQGPSLRTVFTEIYHDNSWNDPESASGRGSTLARTEVIMQRLPAVLRELQAETLLDAACGDFNWMRHTSLGQIEYIGADIVPQLIARNRALFERPGRTFVTLDITRNRLPRADVILCRECLIHLSFVRSRRTIANFKKSGARYLVCTTHTSVRENFDCPDGSWRSLNLQLAPFNFPPPLQLIVEDAETGKSLGLWRLSDL
ncbi:MAG TPA: class I SAM-dependent methyltransferase [Pyrinomonadaceae bacterium]|jgi:SAM-dependent methyltransferase